MQLIIFKFDRLLNYWLISTILENFCFNTIHEKNKIKIYKYKVLLNSFKYIKNYLVDNVISG